MANLGYATIGANNSATPSGYTAATGPYTMPAGGGTLTSFAMYISPSGLSTDLVLRLCLYNDSASKPGSLFSYSDEVTITHGGAAGWVTFPVAAGQPTALVAGNVYWVATGFGASVSAPSWYKQDTGGTQYFKSGTYTAGNPPADPFPSTPSSNSVTVSRYAVYSTTGGSPQTAVMTGLASAQNLGVVTPGVGGVSLSVSALVSAAAFGSAAANPGGVSIPVSGLVSAQQFGAIVAQDMLVQVSGLPSAQQFGNETVSGGVGATFSPATQGGKVQRH